MTQARRDHAARVYIRSVQRRRQRETLRNVGVSLAVFLIALTAKLLSSVG
mgnify:CR=1 FL=1